MVPAELKRRLGPTLFDQAPFPIAVIDPAHRIVLANAAFGRTFGERAGEPCYAVCKGRDAPCESCAAVDAFRDAAPHISDEEGIDAGGHPVAFTEHALPVAGEDGVELVALVCLDTTAPRELERQLRQAERLATVGLTTAGLAHTIKGILAGLEGGIYVVDSGLEQDDHERLGVGWNMVRSYIAQVTTLVQNLLRYARDEQPRREPVEPGALVAEVEQLFASKAALASIELEADVEQGLPPLSLDRDAIRACLINLVSNALDACTWDPDTEKQHRIHLAARRRPEGGVILAVSDNGMGISEENQRKILAAHFTTKGIRGTGLGLLLTQQAVKAHGGTIGFSSTAGEGATFRIELPGTEE